MEHERTPRSKSVNYFAENNADSFGFDNYIGKVGCDAEEEDVVKVPL